MGILNDLSNKLSYEIIKVAKTELKDFVSKQPDQFILTEPTDGKDPIYAYVFDEAQDTVIEQEVKGVFICDGELYACVDSNNVIYNKSDVFREEENWYPLEFYSNLLYDSSLTCILECIEEYVD